MTFDEWWNKAISEDLFRLTAPSAQYRSAKAAWNAAVESIKFNYVCTIDGDGFPTLQCVFDPNYNNGNGGFDCHIANELVAEGKSKFDCAYLKEMQS